jgi:hypothetical protein
MALAMLATPIVTSHQPPQAMSARPVQKARPKASAIARFIAAGDTRPAATARTGPTRSWVSAPCTKS